MIFNLFFEMIENEYQKMEVTSFELQCFKDGFTICADVFLPNSMSKLDFKVQNSKLDIQTYF